MELHENNLSNDSVTLKSKLNHLRDRFRSIVDKVVNQSLRKCDNIVENTRIRGGLNTNATREKVWQEIAANECCCYCDPHTRLNGIDDEFLKIAKKKKSKRHVTHEQEAVNLQEDEGLERLEVDEGQYEEEVMAEDIVPGQEEELIEDYVPADEQAPEIAEDYLEDTSFPSLLLDISGVDLLPDEEVIYEYAETPKLEQIKSRPGVRRRLIVTTPQGDSKVVVVEEGPKDTVIQDSQQPEVVILTPQRQSIGRAEYLPGSKGASVKRVSPQPTSVLSSKRKPVIIVPSPQKQSNSRRGFSPAQPPSPPRRPARQKNDYSSVTECALRGCYDFLKFAPRLNSTPVSMGGMLCVPEQPTEPFSEIVRRLISSSQNPTSLNDPELSEKVMQLLSSYDIPSSRCKNSSLTEQTDWSNINQRSHMPSQSKVPPTYAHVARQLLLSGTRPTSESSPGRNLSPDTRQLFLSPRSGLPRYYYEPGVSRSGRKRFSEIIRRSPRSRNPKYPGSV